MPRETLILVTAMSLAFLAAGIFFLFIRHCTYRDVFIVGPVARTTARRIAYWIVVVFGTTILGFVLGNPLNFILGDTYKFSQLGLLFFTTYFIFRGHKSPELFLQLLVVVAAIAMLKDTVLNWGLISSGARFTTRSIYYLPLLISIQWYLLQRKAGLFWKLLGLGVFLTVVTTLLVGHSRGGVFTSLVGIALFWLIPMRQRGTRIRAIVVPVFILALLAVAINFLLPSPIAGSIDATLARFRIASDFSPYASDDPYAIRIMGSRIPEVVDILGRFAADPGYLAFGFGMGSELETGYGVNLAFGKTHFIHLGWAEILYRCGLLGLGAFLLLAWNFFRFARVCLQRVEIGLLIFVLCIQYGINIFIATPFVSDTIVFAVFGIAVARLEQELAPSGITRAA
jgi:hypothetical protein